MIKKRIKQLKEAEVDMTPMLDIVFILLIFFIVTTSFVEEIGFEVARPDSGQQNSEPKNMVINISEEGQIRFNNKLVDIKRVPFRIERFLAKYKANSILVIPSNNVNYDLLVSVLDEVKAYTDLTIAIGR